MKKNKKLFKKVLTYTYVYDIIILTKLRKEMIGMKNIEFKGIEVSIKIEDEDFENYMKKMGEKRNTQYNIIKDGDIDVNIFNMNLNITTLSKYHYQNSKNETIYVIQQADAQGDDVCFTFYLSDKEIKDNDVIDLINTFDKICLAK